MIDPATSVVFFFMFILHIIFMPNLNNVWYHIKYEIKNKHICAGKKLEWKMRSGSIICYLAHSNRSRNSTLFCFTNRMALQDFHLDGTQSSLRLQQSMATSTYRLMPTAPVPNNGRMTTEAFSIVLKECAMTFWNYIFCNNFSFFFF